MDFLCFTIRENKIAIRILDVYTLIDKTEITHFPNQEGKSDEEIVKPVGKYYEFNNKSHTLSEWSKIVNINYDILRDRVKNLKWSIEKALTTPILKPKEYKKLGNYSN